MYVSQQSLRVLWRVRQHLSRGGCRSEIQLLQELYAQARQDEPVAIQSNEPIGEPVEEVSDDFV